MALSSPPERIVGAMVACERRCNDNRFCRAFNYSPYYHMCELLATDAALRGINDIGKRDIFKTFFEVKLQNQRFLKCHIAIKFRDLSTFNRNENQFTYKKFGHVKEQLKRFLSSHKTL